MLLRESHALVGRRAQPISNTPAACNCTHNADEPALGSTLEAQVLRVLAGKQLDALQVAKAVGLTTAKDVNSTLYSLEEQGRLRRLAPEAGESKPRWEERR